MNLYEIAAYLVKEHGMTMDQIGRLDRWTIRAIYFYPRDEHGGLILKGSGERMPTQREQFFRFYEAFRMPTWWIEDRWRRCEKARSQRRGRPIRKRKG